MEGIPVRPPTSVQATVLNSTAITVSWNPPGSTYINGVNLGYKIFGQTKNDVVFKQLDKVLPDTNDPNSRQTTTLVGLHKFMNYTLKVTCYTGMGSGPFSSEVFAQTEEDGNNYEFLNLISP